MAIPTIFSDICDANGSRVGRRTNDGSIFSETAAVSVPAATAAGVNIGLIFCPAGTKVSRFVASVPDLDSSTNVVLDFGYMYVSTGTDNEDAFVDGSTIGQTGGSIFYPAAAASAAARTAEPDGSFIFEYDGYLVMQVQAGPTTTTGTVTVTADLTAGAIR